MKCSGLTPLFNLLPLFFIKRNPTQSKPLFKTTRGAWPPILPVFGSVREFGNHQNLDCWRICEEVDIVNSNTRTAGLSVCRKAFTAASIADFNMSDDEETLKSLRL
ncbi:MAG: hypothetical protein DMF74_22300 [Acidobacteria bacterium]|nr:MAG: hypothetical protein DMF74_22300 [Acidobacteriota bacterium]